MIIGFQGGLGSGKTVGAVRYVKKDDNENKPILSNIDLYNIEYDELDMSVMLDNDYKSVELFNVSILIDEITVYADCRLSSTKSNRVFSYFILQTRKNSVTLYYTTQDFGMVDLRLYNHTHFYIICEMVFPEEEPELYLIYGLDKEYKCIKDIRRYIIMDMRNRIKPLRTELIIKISDYYGNYDTNQKIQPIVTTKK